MWIITCSLLDDNLLSSCLSVSLSTCLSARPQPALLYLVPACVGFPVIVALFKGELTEMFR